MRSAALRWIVLAFTCAWFGVLVPIHQRGSIQLPGGGTSCCETKKTETAQADVPACHRKPVAPADDHDAPPAKPASNCAVCYFVAALDLPAPVLLTVPPLGPAEPLPTFDLPTPAEREYIATCLERGPPLA